MNQSSNKGQFIPNKEHREKNKRISEIISFKKNSHLIKIFRSFGEEPVQVGIGRVLFDVSCVFIVALPSALLPGANPAYCLLGYWLTGLLDDSYLFFWLAAPLTACSLD